jgi:hypothetical protein
VDALDGAGATSTHLASGGTVAPRASGPPLAVRTYGEVSRAGARIGPRPAAPAYADCGRGAHARMTMYRFNESMMMSPRSARSLRMRALSATPSAAAVVPQIRSNQDNKLQ